MTIEANLIKHSKSAYSNQEIFTFELELPRAILAELHTHRGEVIFNAQSSRAVPIQKYIDEIEQNPFIPIHWGSKQPGMQAYKEQDSLIPWPDAEGNTTNHERNSFWKSTIYSNLARAYAMDMVGYHKQIVNRLIENYSYIRVVLSATNLTNLFHQRIHHAAEPHIRELAIRMYEAIQNSEPETLKNGEWHLPYIRTKRINGTLYYFRMGDEEFQHALTLQAAQRISIACCAQVSYRNLDDSAEKVEKIFNMLTTEGEPGHYSPFCHQAMPMNIYHMELGLPEQIGVSHVMRSGDFCSGQFRHWIQYRKTLQGEYASEFSRETFNNRIREITEKFNNE